MAQKGGGKNGETDLNPKSEYQLYSSFDFHCTLESLPSDLVASDSALLLLLQILALTGVFPMSKIVGSHLGGRVDCNRGARKVEARWYRG